MLSSLIQVMGPWFLAAIALEAVAVFAEQWGAVRSPDEEVRKHGALALLALVLSLLTPGLLLAHGYITTRTQEQTLSPGLSDIEPALRGYFHYWLPAALGLFPLRLHRYYSSAVPTAASQWRRHQWRGLLQQ
jgi:hypothetical protein